jgi:ribosomal protein S3
MVGIDISSAILASLSRRATFRSAGFAVMTNAMHDTIR